METAKNIAQIVAILVAGVWAFSTYVWPEIYRSDQYEPHLFLIAKRDSLHVTEQGVVVSFTILAHNRSNRLLRTVASQYKVSAAIYSTQLSKPSMKVVDALNPSRTLFIVGIDGLCRRLMSRVSVDSFQSNGCLRPEKTMRPKSRLSYRAERRSQPLICTCFTITDLRIC